MASLPAYGTGSRLHPDSNKMHPRVSPVMIRILSICVARLLIDGVLSCYHIRRPGLNRGRETDGRRVKDYEIGVHFARQPGGCGIL